MDSSIALWKCKDGEKPCRMLIFIIAILEMVMLFLVFLMGMEDIKSVSMLNRFLLRP